MEILSETTDIIALTDFRRKLMEVRRMRQNVPNFDIIRGKNGFAKISKNLAKYRFKNNFIELK